MNSAFSELLSARVAAVVAAAKALGQVNHAGLRGSLRETVVRDLLRPMLPPTVGIGHGVIVSAYDEQSTEQDVIIFNRNVVPCLIVDNECGLFPLEASLFTIEVKSKLTSEELKSAHEKARRLEKLRHVPGAAPPEHVIPCLFAFESDLSVKSELDRYREVALDEQHPALRDLCVVGRGHWFWKTDQWYEQKPTPGYAEVLDLMASIIATHERVSASRTKPDLRQYVGVGTPVRL